MRTVGKSTAPAVKLSPLKRHLFVTAVSVSRGYFVRIGANVTTDLNIGQTVGVT
jgi:hypothetical protein